MANLTREHVEHLHGRVQHFHRRALALKERAEEMTEKFVRTLEIGAAATVGGVIHGKAGPEGAHIMGVPVDLGAGLALNLLGYFGVAGKHSDHLNNFGDGMLGAYLSQVGFGIGQKWLSTGKLLGGGAAKSAPATTTTSGASLSPAAMAEIVARVQQGLPIVTQEQARQAA